MSLEIRTRRRPTFGVDRFKWSRLSGFGRNRQTVPSETHNDNIAEKRTLLDDRVPCAEMCRKMRGNAPSDVPPVRGDFASGVSAFYGKLDPPWNFSPYIAFGFKFFGGSQWPKVLATPRIHRAFSTASVLCLRNFGNRIKGQHANALKQR